MNRTENLEEKKPDDKVIFFVWGGGGGLNKKCLVYPSAII